jgi:hypothetical protein
MRSPGLVPGLVLTASLVLGQVKLAQPRREIPRVWDERALAGWATPVAGLNVRPGHFSAEEYYRAPTDNHRTYPVYATDR